MGGREIKSNWRRVHFFKTFHIVRRLVIFGQSKIRKTSEGGA